MFKLPRGDVLCRSRCSQRVSLPELRRRELRDHCRGDGLHRLCSGDVSGEQRSTVLRELRFRFLFSGSCKRLQQLSRGLLSTRFVIL